MGQAVSERKSLSESAAALIELLRARNLQPLDTAHVVPGRDPKFLVSYTDEPDPEAPRKRRALDPAKRAARIVAKNPALVATVKPNGEIEIASKGSRGHQEEIAPALTPANEWD